VRDGGTFSWDRGPVEFFDEHYYDSTTLRRTTRSAVLTSMVLGGLLAAVLFGWLLLERAYRRAAFWALTVGGVIVLTEALKALVKRPELGDFDTEYSFPSGNATASMAAAAAVFLLAGPRLRRIVAIAAVVVVPLYGVALVALLWHYPSDVVAGWALALALVASLRLALGDVSGPLPLFGPHSFTRSPAHLP
jgi:membrane-associated phospholipid phosphatase